MAPFLPSAAVLRVPAEIAADLDAGTRREWLETNGLGSFAMGTVAGPATRRYHGLLCAATRPPLARMMLVNGLEEALVVHGMRHELSAHFYPGAVHPEGYRSLVEFRLDPWPTWVYRVGDVLLERQVFMPHARQITVVSWRLLEPGASGRARLFVKPLVSGRDYHALHHENEALRRDVESGEGLVTLAPYEGVPRTFLHHNGRFVAKPDWYRRFQYPRERERGLDDEEDLFTPGELGFDLTPETEAVVILSLEPGEPPVLTELRAGERLRRGALIAEARDPFEAHLRQAADRFVVRRGEHRTVIAGYPWFTDWGRDTFVSLPGLALASGWRELGRELLLAWAAEVRDGLLPTFFPDAGPDAGTPPPVNSVDAPLWFVRAVGQFAAVTHDDDALARLLPAVRAVIEGFLAGTQHDIGVDDDGLVHAAAPGLQLTWMDAKVDEWVVTPRTGKPVEVQALWVAALESAAALFRGVDDEYARELTERAAWARSSFAASFWSDEDGWLYDVIDGPRRDRTLRPNQLYALGLTTPLVDAARAERVLAACERELLTPVGLRSRVRDADYRGRYEGDRRQRDAAYHEGTVWPYLLGIYADACQRVRGHVPRGLLDGVRAHLGGDGLGLVCEIFDGDVPHRPRGCVAQAWSVAELLRVWQTYLSPAPDR